MIEDLEEKDDNLEEQSELFEHHHFIVDPGQQPLRIDKFLMARIPNISRNKLQVVARNGNILVNNNVVKQNYRVKGNDDISIVMPEPVKVFEMIPEDIPINIEYEDDELVIVNKEPGMVVHPGFGNYSGTLVHALAYHFDNLPSLPTDYFGRPGLVHRLDKNTSGIMVIAKTENTLTNLAKQFFDRTTYRRYYALVWGDFDEDEGRIEGNIGRSLQNRKVMDVFSDGETGKHAVTNYKVLERFGYVTLVECRLETGRTHQIRVHMKHIGHPIFNDFEYGGDRILKGTVFTKYKQFIANCFEAIPRHALHAKSLGFTHPKTGEEMRFDSELPADLENVLEKWRRYKGN